MDIEEVFSQFLFFCGKHLDKSKDILKLVKKRYNDCDPEFIASEEFTELIETTQDKIQEDSSRIFVHIKQFLDELKEHRFTKDARRLYMQKTNGKSSCQSHSGEKRGIKRSGESEMQYENNVPLKHPRLTDVVEPSADEGNESSESDIELPKTKSKNALFKNQVSKRSRSESPSDLHSDENQTNLLNWHDFKFKKSVMGSVQAAASSFSKRLSKTILKANRLNIKISGSRSDCDRLGTDYSSSRTPSPSLRDQTISETSSLECVDDVHEIQHSKDKFSTDKPDKGVEVLGSTEISSTTTNLDFKTGSSDKKYRKSPAAAECSSEMQENLKKDAKMQSDIKLKKLGKINGKTVKTNVSSDDDIPSYNNSDAENDIHCHDNEADYFQDETINFTTPEKINISSESNKSDELETQTVFSQSSSFTKQVNGTRIKKVALTTSRRSRHCSRTRHSSSKSQSSVILIETDESTSSDAETSEQRHKEAFNLVPEDSDSDFAKRDSELGSKSGTSKVSKTEMCDKTETRSDKSKYRRIELTKVDSPEEYRNKHRTTETKEFNFSEDDESIHVSEEEKKDSNFPALLGLISISEFKEEMATRKLKNECKKNQVTVFVDKLDDKTRLKYLGPAPTTSQDRAEETQGSSKAGKGSKRQIQQLETLLTQIRDKIEEVRGRELGLDDLDNEASDYILEDKLKKKFVSVFKKLCQLHKAEATTGRPTEKFFRYEGTRFPEINRKITRFINKRQEFPDYQDIRKLIVRTNKAKGLNLRRNAIDELSREAFTDVGNRLQKRRHEDFMGTFTTPFANPVSEYDDPALLDPVLKKKLDSNKKDAKSRMDAVVEKYTQLQNKIGDRDVSDDDSDVSVDQNVSPEKLEIQEEDEPDVILIEDGEPVEKQGLGIVARSGRAPLFLESSQLEIGDNNNGKDGIEIARKRRLFHARHTVNDEEEDIGPYFEQTQVDNDDRSPAATDSRPKSWVYDNETLVVSDEEIETPDNSENRSENNCSSSPDPLAVFNEGDEIEMVTDYSDSEGESDLISGTSCFKETEEKKTIFSEIKDEAAVGEKIKDSAVALNVSEQSIKKNKVKKKKYAVENISETMVKICLRKSSESPIQTVQTKDICKDKTICKVSNSCVSDNCMSTAKDKKWERTDMEIDYIDKDLNQLAKQIEIQHQSDSDSDVEMRGFETVLKSKRILDHNESTLEGELSKPKSLTMHKTSDNIENHQPIQPDKMETVPLLSGSSPVNQTNQPKHDSVTTLANSNSASTSKVGDNLVNRSFTESKTVRADLNETSITMSKAMDDKETNLKESKTSTSEKVKDVEIVDISEIDSTCGSDHTSELIAQKASENIEISQVVTSVSSADTIIDAETNKTAVESKRTPTDNYSEVQVLGKEHIEPCRTVRSDSPTSSCISVDSSEDVHVPDNKTVNLKVGEKSEISGNTSQSSVLKTSDTNTQAAESITVTKDNVQSKEQIKSTVHEKVPVVALDDGDSDIEIIEEYNVNDEYYAEEYFPDNNQGHYNHDISSNTESQGSYSSKNLNFESGYSNSQGSFLDDSSSKNLSYSEASYSYEESGLEWEEEEYPLDSTSSYAHAQTNSENYSTYEDEITSTSRDTSDMEVSNRLKSNLVNAKAPNRMSSNPVTVRVPNEFAPRPVDAKGSNRLISYPVKVKAPNRFSCSSVNEKVPNKLNNVSIQNKYNKASSPISLKVQNRSNGSPINIQFQKKSISTPVNNKFNSGPLNISPQKRLSCNPVDIRNQNRSNTHPVKMNISNSLNMAAGNRVNIDSQGRLNNNPVQNKSNRDHVNVKTPNKFNPVDIKGPKRSNSGLVNIKTPSGSFSSNPIDVQNKWKSGIPITKSPTKFIGNSVGVNVPNKFNNGNIYVKSPNKITNQSVNVDTSNNNHVNVQSLKKKFNSNLLDVTNNVPNRLNSRVVNVKSPNNFTNNSDAKVPDRSNSSLVNFQSLKKIDNNSVAMAVPSKCNSELVNSPIKFHKDKVTNNFGSGLNKSPNKYSNNPVDAKVSDRLTKAQFKAASVTLKKPNEAEPLVKPVISVKNENLDLIEIYDEPDSTPYTDEMEVTSSGQNEPIVLSDSE